MSKHLLSDMFFQRQPPPTIEEAYIFACGLEKTLQRTERKPKRHPIGTKVLVHDMAPQHFLGYVTSYEACDDECQVVSEISDNDSESPKEWIVPFRLCIRMFTPRTSAKHSQK